MNVAQTILSRGNDDAPAVFHQNTVLTYAQLRREVIHLAYGLLNRGHGKGDRIGICSENSPFFVSVYLGVIRAGLVAVPFPTDISEAGFGKVIREAAISTLFVSRRFYNRLLPWSVKVGVTLLTGSERGCSPGPTESAFPIRTPPERQPWEVTGDGHRGLLPGVDPARDLAALMYTSGSTGAPKGVMVTHRNIDCNLRDIIDYTGLSPVERAMVVLPFHYCFGLSLLHSLLAAGGSLVLNNQFMYPESVLMDMLEKGCTGLAGVPSTYQILLRKSRFKQMQFPNLRWFQQAGGKLHNPFIQEIQQAFPQVDFFLMYGQTEATARLSYLPPERLNDKLGSIGQGLPSTRLEVIKPDGTAVLPGSEELGEIVASGDNITAGYLNDPEETQKYFKNGKLHTGDLARVDEDGFIYIVERDRDMIKSGGNRVSAKEVENVIAEMPEVVEVAVLGMLHDLLGEAILGFLVLVTGASITAEDVKKYCQRRLPPFKTPEEVFIVKSMPHSSSGKILKLELKRMLESRRSNGTHSMWGRFSGTA